MTGFRVVPLRTRLLLALVAGVYALLLTPGGAHAGEFGATFNYRLTCEYSSWHEGRVTRVSGNRLTVTLVRDLLRRAPRKTYTIRWTADDRRCLHKGDLILVNCWTKPRRIDWNTMPASMPFEPMLMGKIGAAKRAVTSYEGWGYSQPMLTWFYRTGRWDARVVTAAGGSPGHCAWYAKLPNGRRYLIYDAYDRMRAPEYPSR